MSNENLSIERYGECGVTIRFGNHTIHTNEAGLKVFEEAIKRDMLYGRTGTEGETGSKDPITDDSRADKEVKGES